MVWLTFFMSSLCNFFFKGGTEYFVEPSILTFVNHGCNGTFNMLDWSAFRSWRNDKEGVIVTEMNATVDDYESYRENMYDIFTDRPIAHSALSYAVASRDTKAGEEITIFYVSGLEAWIQQSEDLKSICSGETPGFITQTESDSKDVE